jgi:arabinogalactan oligomer/maltooligosaccharide transport system permease protein
MVLMAFTNFDTDHQVPGHLFHWTGLSTFMTLFGVSSGGGMLSQTFWPVLGWTVIWAFFATFSNYILGMLLAMLINKKGIKFKKFFRTIFILSMAVPSFVSLLLMRSLLDDNGPLNALLRQLNLTTTNIQFLSAITPARITIIVVNLWIGIPYTLLITTGILMNIPSDLYEAARIDGASPFSIYKKIVLPYMLYVTTPYLITQFIGNLNNFNVIYLLSGGGPNTLDYYQAGKTDLLVTWLYKLVNNTNDNCYASAIVICVFILCSIPSLIAYHHTTSYKDEEVFQ